MDFENHNGHHHPHMRDVSIPIQQILLTAGWVALVLLIAPLVLFALIWGFGTLWDGFRQIHAFTALALVLIFIVLHEGIHAIGWKLFGGLEWSDLSFGVDWKTLSPYCHAHAPMRARAYRVGAALPGIITGIVPLLIGLLSGGAGWALLGAFMTSAAVGDAYVLWAIRDIENNARVIDHPENAGCYVLMDEEEYD